MNNTTFYEMWLHYFNAKVHFWIHNDVFQKGNALEMIVGRRLKFKYNFFHIGRLKAHCMRVYEHMTMQIFLMHLPVFLCRGTKVRTLRDVDISLYYYDAN